MDGTLNLKPILKDWQRKLKLGLIVIMSLFIMNTSFYAVDKVMNIGNEQVTSVDAGIMDWIGSVVDDVAVWAKKQMGIQKVSEAITDGEYAGKEYFIYPEKNNLSGINYKTPGFGAASDSGPFSTDKLKSDKTNLADGEEGAKKFMAFQMWAQQYKVYSARTSLDGQILFVFQALGRLLVGGLLWIANVIGIAMEIFGQLVYESISIFNIFSYVEPTPDPGADWSIVSTGNNKLDGITGYLGAWLNAGRTVGYLLALLFFILGITFTVLGVRGPGQGSRIATMNTTLKRFLMSIFSLTGLVMLLSSLVTTFASTMQSVDDELTIETEIAGLILDYKGFVTENYFLDDKAADVKSKLGELDDYNGSWQIDTSASKSLNYVTSRYLRNQTFNINHNQTLSTSEVLAINKATGAYSGSSKDDKDLNLRDQISKFANSNVNQMINNYAISQSTSSEQMKNVYGEKSMPFAIYSVYTGSNGAMRIEDDALISQSFVYSDYVIPGGIMSQFKIINVILKVAAITIVSYGAYKYMLKAMFRMVVNAIPQLPGAFALGSTRAISLIIKTVLMMMLQIMIARTFIGLTIDIINLGPDLFLGLKELAIPGTIIPIQLLGGLM